MQELDTRAPRPERNQSGERADVLGPLLSAAIFGYFGFFAGLSTGDASGTVPLYLATVWVFRIAAVLFLVSAGVAVGGMRRSLLVYGLISGVATLGLLGVTVWSIADQERDIAASPLIMVLCIIWNAYGSFMAIRAGIREGS